jgi:hypothetical protein
LHIQELRYLVDRAGISGATRAEFLEIRQVKRGLQRVKVADFQGPQRVFVRPAHEIALGKPVTNRRVVGAASNLLPVFADL